MKLKQLNDSELNRLASLKEHEDIDDARTKGLQLLLDQMLDFVPSKARERLCLEQLAEETNPRSTRYYEVLASQYAVVDESVLPIEHALNELKYNAYFPAIFAVCCCMNRKKIYIFWNFRKTISLGF